MVRSVVIFPARRLSLARSGVNRRTLLQRSRNHATPRNESARLRFIAKQISSRCS
jgi:hypothetical protein